MTELRLVTPPPRVELRQRLRVRLGDVVPGWRTLAEGILAAESPIDFVGVEPSGRTVLILLGEAGEDLELVGRALAHRAWLEPRLGDWLQLAPELGIRPEAGLLAQLLAPSFRPEARAAARALGPSVIALGTYRFVRNGTGIDPLLERILDDEPPGQKAPPPAAVSSFRTGLTDSDLSVSEDEQAELES